MALACVFPVVSLVTCEDANSSSAGMEIVIVSLGSFGAAVLFGWVALVLRLVGARGSSAVAVVFNMLGVGATLYSFITHFQYTRGRQIRTSRGRVLPRRQHGRVATDWRSRAASAWRSNGDTETASVSAFSLLSLDLAAMGAPLELVRGAHESALEEIVHAERCYALARQFGDVEASVTPMSNLHEARSKQCSLTSIAVESWVEGAYLETVSAELANALATTVTDGAVRDVLKTVARDEAKHAAHAWSVIEWCLAQDPVRVRSALASVADGMKAPDPPDDEPGSDGSLEHVGIPGRDLQREIAAQCLVGAKQRLAVSRVWST
jgi:hypothetical protein